MSSSKQDFYSRINLSARWFRLVMNLWPPFFGLRIHIARIAPYWREIMIRMKLSLRNMNYVGIQFGGGLFAMTDPFFMLMLMHVLGSDYLVRDKSANIQFLKPGRGAVHAGFRLSHEQINEVREKRQVVKNSSRPGASISSMHPAKSSQSSIKRFTFAANRKTGRAQLK